MTDGSGIAVNDLTEAVRRVVRAVEESTHRIAGEHRIDLYGQPPGGIVVEGVLEIFGRADAVAD